MSQSYTTVINKIKQISQKDKNNPFSAKKNCILFLKQTSVTALMLWRDNKDILCDLGDKSSDKKWLVVDLSGVKSYLLNDH